MSACRDSSGNGKLLLSSLASWRRPWYCPQSNRYRFPLASSSCMDPVTVCAAPQKVIFMDAVIVSSDGGLQTEPPLARVFVLPPNASHRCFFGHRFSCLNNLQTLCFENVVDR